MTRAPRATTPKSARESAPGSLSPYSASKEKSSASGGLHEVYHRIRQDILSGELAPGAILNTVHIAARYGVSRTPVREALRMLQAENLVDAQFQHRTRVTNVTPQEVDEVYATWILMQSLGIALTVPLVTVRELDRMNEILDSMSKCSPEREGAEEYDWEGLHMEFHRLLVTHAGTIIRASTENCWSRSERARRLHIRSAPKSWLASDAEHRDVVSAFEQGSIVLANHAASRQLARNALAVIAGIDPTYEPRAIRHALKLTQQSDGPGNKANTGSMFTGI